MGLGSRIDIKLCGLEKGPDGNKAFAINTPRRSGMKKDPCSVTELFGLCGIYVSIRRKDGMYCKRNSLLSVRAALDRYLKSPPYNKKLSICINYLFNEASKNPNSYLKQLVNESKIAGPVHENPLISEIILPCRRAS